MSQISDAGSATPLQYRSKTDLVASYLRERLQAGAYGPGERLVVSRVAEQLGVSKVPVREAVTRLVGERLLVLKPNIGPAVPEFTAHEVIETALMRCAIETLALEHAVPRHSKETLARASEILEAMTDEEADFPALNVAFHLALMEPTPHREVLRIAGSLLEQAQRFGAVHLVPGYRADAQREHVELLALVERRDLAALRVQNDAHIMNAAHRLAELVDADNPHRE